MDESGRTEGLRLVQAEGVAAKQAARLRAASLLRWTREMRPDNHDKLSADPAWDLLVEMYIHHLNDYRSTISDLSAAIDLPESTTTRWVALLKTKSWVQQWDGSEGGVTLTAYSIVSLNTYFDRMVEGLEGFSRRDSDCAKPATEGI